METPAKSRIAITGASGLVGRRLCSLLTAAGHQVIPVRRDASSASAQWNVDTGAITFPGDQSIDTLIHLAGYNVAQRWTARVKKLIWDSRVPATEKLCTFLSNLPAEKRPRSLISASAIGIYGSRADELLTEDSPLASKGQGFLSDVCLAWEAATRPAADAGIRVAHVRVGVVLSKEGGALAKLATPVKLCLGGPVGPGTQFMPWISNTDLCRLFACLAVSPDFRGTVNGVGPAPVRQHEFTRTLGKILHRPTVFPMPTFMVKLFFGQMGVEALLSSLRVIPAHLPAGFTFEHTTLESAIRAELNRPAS
ncbi:MAG TPA: TIGR01777 family oxidoreductase [Phycisphaerae bacterium]